MALPCLPLGAPADSRAAVYRNPLRAQRRTETTLGTHGEEQAHWLCLRRLPWHLPWRPLDSSQEVSPRASPRHFKATLGMVSRDTMASLSPDAMCCVGVARRPGFCLHFNSGVVLFIAIYCQEFYRQTKHGSVVFCPRKL